MILSSLDSSSTEVPHTIDPHDTRENPDMNEELVMKKELDWLLAESIPDSILYIKKALDGVTILEEKDPKGHAVNSQLNLVATTSAYSGSDAKGTATISGSLVRQLSLDIAISSQFNQGKPTSIYLKKNETIILHQIQKAKNYINSAISKLQKIPLFEMRDTALGFVQEIMRYIESAREILMSSNQQNLLPLQSENTSKFAPMLPENLVIECELGDGVFITHAYWLKFRNGIKSTGILDTFKRDPSARHMLMYSGHLAEVRREIVFEADYPHMKASLNCLNDAFGICADICSQIHAFDSL